MVLSLEAYERLVRLYGERYKRPDWLVDKTGNTPGKEPALPSVTRKELNEFFENDPGATDDDALNWMAYKAGREPVIQN